MHQMVVQPVRQWRRIRSQAGPRNADTMFNEVWVENKKNWCRCVGLHQKYVWYFTVYDLFLTFITFSITDLLLVRVGEDAVRLEKLHDYVEEVLMKTHWITFNFLKKTSSKNPLHSSNEIIVPISLVLTYKRDTFKDTCRKHVSTM